MNCLAYSLGLLLTCFCNLTQLNSINLCFRTWLVAYLFLITSCSVEAGSVYLDYDFPLFLLFCLAICQNSLFINKQWQCIFIAYRKSIPQKSKTDRIYGFKWIIKIILMSVQHQETQEPSSFLFSSQSCMFHSPTQCWKTSWLQNINWYSVINESMKILILILEN